MHLRFHMGPHRTPGELLKQVPVSEKLRAHIKIAFICNCPGLPLHFVVDGIDEGRLVYAYMCVQCVPPAGIKSGGLLHVKQSVSGLPAVLIASPLILALVRQLVQ